MSKPVTNEEVEDVLSSIRRLVSEDKRPLAGLSSTPKAPEPVAAAAPDRLVLTPALRVADISHDTGTAQNDDGALNDGPLDLASVARETWTQTDEAEEGPSAAEDQHQPATTEFDDEDREPDAAMDALDALVQQTLEPQAQSEETGLEDGDYGDESYWHDEEDHTQSDEAQQDHTTSADHAEVQADFGDDVDWDDGLEPDHAETDASGDPAREPFFDDDPQPEYSPEVDLRAASIPLKATIAALGAAIGKTRQDWEPDGDEAETLSAADAGAMVWEDDVELDAKGAPLPAEETSDDADADTDAPKDVPIGAAFGGDDQLMDEEALRDLVAEIVRAELQGALGERITRNVRKLVRREIHRALTAQELD